MPRPAAAAASLRSCRLSCGFGACARLRPAAASFSFRPTMESSPSPLDPDARGSRVRIALRSSQDDGMIFTEIHPFGTAGTEGARDMARLEVAYPVLWVATRRRRLFLGVMGAPRPASAAARRLPMDLPRPGLLAAAAAAALSFEGSSSDDAAWARSG